MIDQHGQLYTHVDDLLAQMPAIPADSIVSRTLHNDRRIRVILFGFAPGQELTEHTSSMAAVLHFLQGEARLTLGSKTIEAVPGTWAYMEPNLSHSIQARSSVMMMLTLIKESQA